MLIHLFFVKDLSRSNCGGRCTWSLSYHRATSTSDPSSHERTDPMFVLWDWALSKTPSYRKSYCHRSNVKKVFCEREVYVELDPEHRFSGLELGLEL